MADAIKRAVTSSRTKSRLHTGPLYELTLECGHVLQLKRGKRRTPPTEVRCYACETLREKGRLVIIRGKEEIEEVWDAATGMPRRIKP